MPTDEPPIRRPETKSQGLEWEKTKNRYLNEGLCPACAAQAAWGHQCGFATVNPPCEKCAGRWLTRATLDRNGYRGQEWLQKGAVRPANGGDG